MSIKCGKCKERHETVADVRACYGGERVTVMPRQAGKNTERYRALPSGRYAVLGLDDDEPYRVRFFKVDNVTEGKWSGYTFVKEQASDEFHPVKSKERRERILNAILKDPETAMLLYGQELGKCGHCGRTLTDEDSRARGIGPICAGKVSF